MMSLYLPRCILSSLARQCRSATFTAAAPTHTNHHTTSIVHPSADIHPSATVGPFCIVGEHVVIGPEVHLQSHCVVEGHTTLGARCAVHSHAIIGTQSQDKKCTGKSTHTDIGADCTIREFVTINRGTESATTIGTNVHLLANVHVGHDCTVEDDVVVSNGSCLAGHVWVGRGAIVGGLCGIQQRIRIGQLAMVGGASAVDRDVMPYGLVMGNRATLRGINLIGLRRKGVSRNEISCLLASQRYLYPAVHAEAGSSFAPPLDLPLRPTLQERQQELALAIAQKKGTMGKSSTLVQEVLAFLQQ